MPVLTTLQWGRGGGLLPLVTRIKTFVTVDVPWDQRPCLPVKSTKTIANPHLPANNTDSWTYSIERLAGNCRGQRGLSS